MGYILVWSRVKSLTTLPGRMLAGMDTLTFPITKATGTVAGNGIAKVQERWGTEGKMQIN